MRMISARTYKVVYNIYSVECLAASGRANLKREPLYSVPPFLLCGASSATKGI